MKLNIPKPLKITLIIILIIAILLLYLGLRSIIINFFAWTTLAVFSLLAYYLTPPPPPPQIEYAEFPIKLVYEIDGTEYEIKDTIICEYDDWEIVGDSTKQRVWKKRFESGRDEFVIYDNGETEIYCKYLSAAAYMGDKEIFGYNDNPTLRFVIEPCTSHGGYCSTKELFEEFGITKIRFYPPEPIENSFSYLNYFR